MMLKTAVSHLCLAAALLLAAGLSAHPLPDVAPFGADRDIAQIDVHAYSVSVRQGESITFDADTVKRVWVDEARNLDVTHTDDGKIVLTGKRPGKVVARFFHTNKSDIVMDDNAKHGIGLFIDTFIVTITAPP